MKITTKTLDNRQVRLTIKVDEEQTQEAMQRAARQIAKQVNIPGFRKGKAPYKLIVERYGGDTIRQEAADLLAEEVYRQALEQEDIHPFAPASLDKVEMDPLTFAYTIPLPPTVDAAKYRKFRLKPAKVKIAKKQVREALERIREENALLERAERPAALEDGVVIKIEAKSSAGKTFLDRDDVQIILQADDPYPAPGFAEALVGMTEGEQRTFTLTLPDDMPQQDLQGAKAEFTVVLKEVYDRTVPALDDDLARTVGKFDSLKELEQDVEKRLHDAAQAEADEEYTQKVVQAVIKQAKIAYPPVMLEESVDELVEDLEQNVSSRLHLSLEDYLRFQDQTMDGLREDLRPNAVAQLERALLLGEIVQLEKLQVADEEIEARIEEMSAPWGIRADEVRQSLSSPEGQRSIRNQLLGSKAVERLVAIAKGEAPDIDQVEE